MIGSTFCYVSILTLYPPGLYMMDDDKLDDIRGLEEIPRELENERCAVCLRHSFYSAKCDDDSCTMFCHPHCGVLEGWEIHFVANGERLTPRMLCPRHCSRRRGDASPQSAFPKFRGGSLQHDSLICPICKIKWDGDKLMIKCDTCSEFYHGTCVLISENKAKSMSRFTCPKCPVTCGSIKKTERMHKRTRGLEKGIPRAGNSHSKLAHSKFSQSAAVQLDINNPSTRLMPERRILFHWNEKQSYEGVVICRASELRRKDGRRRCDGPDWWQVRWTTGAGNVKDIVLLADSNQDRWELLPDCTAGGTTSGRAALAVSRSKISPHRQSDRSEPTKRTSRTVRAATPTPFEPVSVFCTPKGVRATDCETGGILRVGSRNPRKVVVEYQGQELSLTDFEALAGNSGKRPKLNIRLTETGESVADFLDRMWGIPCAAGERQGQAQVGRSLERTD